MLCICKHTQNIDIGNYNVKRERGGDEGRGGKLMTRGWEAGSQDSVGRKGRDWRRRRVRLMWQPAFGAVYW